MNYAVADVLPYMASVLNTCVVADRPRVLLYLNRAMERIIMLGKWKNTIARYRFCTFASTITLPMELENILFGNVNGNPIDVRNEWYEFISSGPGDQSLQTSQGQEFYDRGDGFVTVFDPCAPFTLAVHCDLTEASTATMQVIGLDLNGVQVRSMLPAGTYVDGVTIPLAFSSYAYTGVQWSKITQIILPVTNGTVRLYAIDVATGTSTLLGVYLYNYTIPNFRRYYFPGIDPTIGAQVQVLGKRRFIPVVNDTDLLVIQNIPALEEMIKSTWKRDVDNYDQADACENKAMMYLHRELGEWRGRSPSQVQLIGFETYLPGCGIRALL